MTAEHSRIAGRWLAVFAAMMLIVAACGDDDAVSDADDSEDDAVAEEVAETDDESTATPEAEAEPEPTQQPEATDELEVEGEEETVQQPSQQWDQPPEMQLKDGADYKAVLTTNRGEVTINLLQDDAPTTVNNFVFLAEQNFYENVPFHRVISGFMIQTGDPTGTGAGGPGYRFEDEEVTRDYTPGTVAMANAGPNTNGSQFFIVHGDLRGQLPPNYTIFGEVTDGMDIVDQIANVPVQQSRSGEMSSPTEEVYIESVEIRS
jgi:cyclophilin family peptidyl-prolyl cis-trans isomerase